MLKRSASAKLTSKSEKEYKLIASYNKYDVINISLIDVNNFVRFSRRLTKKSVKKLGKAVGYEKSIDTFWKILYTGIKKNSKNVLISILRKEDAECMVKMRIPKPKAMKFNYIYIIMHLKFEFESFYFPILLKERDYSRAELLQMLVNIKKENKKIYEIAKIEENKKISEKLRDLENKTVSIKKQKDDGIKEFKSFYFMENSYSNEAKEYAEELFRRKMIKELELL